MKNILLVACLVWFPLALHGDEVTDLKIALAIAEVRAQRLEGMLSIPPPAEANGITVPVPYGGMVGPFKDMKAVNAWNDSANGKPTRSAPREQKFQRVEVTKYRDVEQKYCYFIGRRKYCGTRTVQQPYTTYELVPIETPPANVQQSAADYATPPDVIDRALEILQPKADEVFLDVGSGDGRVVIEAVKRFGCKAYGIESDPERVALARRNAAMEGLHGDAIFIEGDFTKFNWGPDYVVYAYQFPEELEKIKHKLRHSKRVVTFAHAVPGFSMTSHNGGELYSWRSQSKAATTEPGVWWGGRFYTKPPCNRWNCAMCNAIRAGLRAQGGNY